MLDTPVRRTNHSKILIDRVLHCESLSNLESQIEIVEFADLYALYVSYVFSLEKPCEITRVFSVSLQLCLKKTKFLEKREKMLLSFSRVVV